MSGAIAALFGPYRLQRLLGVSRVSEVWAGTGPGDARVAVKRLLPHLAHDPLLRAALGHEAAVLAAAGCDAAGAPLADPWPAPRLVEVDLQAERAALPFLARGNIRGAPLSALQASPLQARLYALGALAEALAVLHARGLACGDVAPRNIVIDLRGRAWLIDLGLGSSPAIPEVAELHGVATPAFAAPEVAAGGRAVPESDVFAFATLACWLLVGATPWSALRGNARREAIAAAHRTPGSPRPPDAVAGLLLPCWSRDPAERPSFARLADAWPRSVEGARLLADAVLQVPQGEPLQVCEAAEDRGETITGPDDPDATRVASE